MALSAEWLLPLASLSPRDLGPDQRLTLALVLQRMVSVTESLALAALGEVPYRSCVPDPALAQTSPEVAARVCPGGARCRHGWQLDELSALTGLPTWLMSLRIGWAGSLRQEWAGLAPLLAAGLLTTEHLRRFERATLGATEEATAAAVAAAVEMATDNPGLAADSLARVARRTASRHTSPEETLARRRKNRAEEIGVRFDDLHDGLAAVSITAEAHQIEAIRALIREHPAITRPDAEDTRNRGQRQADLLIGLCLGALDPARFPMPGTTGLGTDIPGAEGPGTQGSGTATRAESAQPAPAGSAAAAVPAVGVIITASIETLLGLSNEPGLVGDTIIPATLARHWAADPAWARRAVIDHNGVLSALSRKQRKPALRLRETVRSRWGRCTFPGCQQPARASQLDHAVPYRIGGLTDLANLHPLCARHHRLKDQPGVHVRLEPDGRARWTLPSGRTMRVPAPDLRPRPGPYDGRGWCDECIERDPSKPPAARWEEPDYEAWVARVIAADPGHDPADTENRLAPDDLWGDEFGDAA